MPRSAAACAAVHNSYPEAPLIARHAEFRYGFEAGPGGGLVGSTSGGRGG